MGESQQDAIKHVKRCDRIHGSWADLLNISWTSEHQGMFLHHADILQTMNHPGPKSNPCGIPLISELSESYLSHQHRKTKKEFNCLKWSNITENNWTFVRTHANIVLRFNDVLKIRATFKLALTQNRWIHPTKQINDVNFLALKRWRWRRH